MKPSQFVRVKAVRLHRRSLAGRVRWKPKGEVCNDRSDDQWAGGGHGEAEGTSEIEHVELAKALREPLGHTSQGVSDTFYFEAPHTLRAQNDPGMRFLPADRLLGEDDKVPNISGHKGPAFSGGTGKLLTI